MISMNPRAVLKAIIKAGELAHKLGVKIIGLGAYAALVGNKGIEISQKVKLPVTTGAAYTLAMIPEAILRAMTLLEIPIDKAKILIIGATGSISRVCVEILGHSVNRRARKSCQRDRLGIEAAHRFP